ncbi:MAG: hypothetical protein ACFFCW_10940 [Candidatus Hodarchaeota archaeon]
MNSGWRPSRREYVQYFIIASVVTIGLIVGLLFLGLWLGKQISFGIGILGAAVGGMVGLALGTLCLYHMALNWEKKVLDKMGKQLCPCCKRSFEKDTTKCPHCEYEIAPMT